ncbi:uncharacterized protein J7T54_001095 [Emericellopsis cladophorae]|uniref:FAD/NAD(P)-binding domain-containing protein n=1 Tax=Emericellopsis cladophorae TaxID=2686198 RepID=A0A9Q0BCX4_9HYPO|nr:uncharacterized protein J7T54_001095 [Emericellopsis cladophorae]KAI6780787.1 hypothetical protein J7T54_001095 [Emericellopsis cladophorae]
MNAFFLRQQIRVLGSTPPEERNQNIVVVGASFAGYHAARIMARSLPRNSHCRVVGLPSRVNATDKAEGMKLLREFQTSIQIAKRIVVVGGGAAGVELATDAKSKYPDKHVTLVHSRNAPMHLWASRLQKAALEGLERLRFAKLSSNSIASTGHIKVNPNLSIKDESFSDRVYICGDVADTQTPNPNARSAMLQGSVVADNILLAIKGRKPRHVYKNHWLQGFIKLTLGLDRSVSLFGNGKTALLFNSREKREDLMAAQGWKHLGAKPFVDEPSSHKLC